jgi:hypothetical protein
MGLVFSLYEVILCLLYANPSNASTANHTTSITILAKKIALLLSNQIKVDLGGNEYKTLVAAAAV